MLQQMNNLVPVRCLFLKYHYMLCKETILLNAETLENNLPVNMRNQIVYYFITLSLSKLQVAALLSDEVHVLFL